MTVSQSHIVGGPPQANILEIVGRNLPPGWIAGAALLAIAGSGLAMATRREIWESAAESASLQATVTAWAMRQHIPTNAELLAAFQDYGR